MSASTMSRPVVHLALELSVTSWLIAYRLPWSDKVRLLRVSAGDGAALLALVSDLREKVAARTGQDATLASCFEAGRDGFWLHRLLTDNGVVNHVVEDLKLPPNITLVHLPPYAPELNPMENVWEYLRGNQLAIPVFHSYEDILDTACDAWMFFENDKERTETLATRSWATVNV